MGPCSYADYITLYLFHHSDGSFLDYWFKMLPEKTDADMDDPDVADRIFQELDDDLSKRAVLIFDHELTAIRADSNWVFSPESDEISEYLELYREHWIDSDYRPTSYKRITNEARREFIQAIDNILVDRDRLVPNVRQDLEGVRAIFVGAQPTAHLVSCTVRET